MDNLSGRNLSKYIATCGPCPIVCDVIDTMHKDDWELRRQAGKLRLFIPPERERAVWTVVKARLQPECSVASPYGPARIYLMELAQALDKAPEGSEE